MTITPSERLIHLHAAPYLTWHRLRTLYYIDPSFSAVYTFSPTRLQERLKLSGIQAAGLFEYLHNTSPGTTAAYYHSCGVKTVTSLDSSYPQRLLSIYDPPWVLYFLGEKALFHSSKMLAVVGSRTPTAYGKKVISMFMPELSRDRVTIISGLAAGVDGEAHKQCIANGGRTIAVLGSGFKHIYPKQHTELARQIKKDHLLVSEYPPDVPPQKWQFPMRNRIISALSDAVFVVEAKERSGSLITAYQGLDQGRDIKALPGPILSKESAGTNQLIAEGAEPVLKYADLMAASWI
ncbi:DNA processing protein [Sinobaca qinghaiensis]|uniref:DNA processing protein n=1 Tax=Sinobaca qinghaiensis TaxID=342944 RepID=A0A419V5X8_9BACL|nr:DNA-processing protein DprA [Sinobaca qinghaiensis]RKD75384.1 DNA processing protein [Sinobaca qinghaiensis]